MKNEAKKIPTEIPLRTLKEIPENTPIKAPFIDPKAKSKKKSNNTK